MNSTPIAHDDAGEAPLFAQNVSEKPLILRRIVTVDLVVSAHHRPWFARLDDVFKSWQVNFAQCAFADALINLEAVCFLVIGCEMLEGCANSLGLHAFDNSNSFVACQEGVFTPKFEAAAIQRVALDVHAWAENDSYFFLAAFFTHGNARFSSNFWIPARSHGSCWWEAGGRNRIGMVDEAFCLTQTVRPIGDHEAFQANALDRRQVPSV